MDTKERVDNALKATRALGIPDKEAKPVLRQLWKVFDKKWELIEAEDYRALIDGYFELKENEGQEDENKGLMKDAVSERPSKRQHLEGQEGRSSSTRDNLKQISNLEEEGDFSLSVPGRGIREVSQSCSGSTRDRRIASSTSMQVKDPFPSQIAPRAINSTSERASHSPSSKKPMLEPGSDPFHRKNASMQVKNPIPYQSDPRAINSTSERALHSLSSKKPIVEPGSYPLHRQKVPSNTHNRKVIKPRAEQIVNNLSDFAEPIAVVHPNTACPGSLEGSCNLVRVQHGMSARDQKRFFHKLSDITKGAENVKISLVDEVGKEHLPKFSYMPHNVIYQNAYVQISLARIADADCCSSCSGDCVSSSIPCACARETGGEFAYTRQGLLKEEFLRACVSMKRNPQKHHFVFCQDCPIERSKNEDLPEPCKGHLIRKFIKECWRKCGCNMDCGNRVVQRGITCNLQVFFTREGKGWGLRTLQDLPEGSFVCEYVGEILTNTELYERNIESSGGSRHTYPVTLDADWGSERVLRDEEALCLDATFSGNVARFINHRCYDANLIDIPVEVETPDRHYYHLAFFTTRKVNALEELTWDYGIDFNDLDHPIKAFQCCCGSAYCRDVKQKG